MIWSPLDTWIVVTGVLCALSCALLGSFLLVRRLSMMGDAISHAVLPGLAAAFVFSGSRGSIPMLAGAVVAGLMTALLTQWISRLGRVEESASMGVVFTTLFALGLVLIVRAADSVDLDPGCVLYGAIELTPLDTVNLVGLTVPRAAVIATVALALNTLVVLLFYKEFKISAFDPALATALGFSARAMHYLLMVLVALTSVACFESVGSILVIAMLIVPAAAAHLLTDRLGAMVGVSLLLAAASAAGGHLAAITVPTWFGFADTSTAGMMAVVAGLIFLAAMFFAPRHGLVSRWLHRAALSLRIAREDLLGALYRGREARPDAAMQVAELRRAVRDASWFRSLALHGLRVRGWVAASGQGLSLTASGLAEAERIIRSHRLWEQYLFEQAQVRADHVHASSEKLEHVTDPGLQRELAQEVGTPTRDPHGHRIPE
jgi:manganese/zinc/iron transport system permease protein